MSSWYSKALGDGVAAAAPSMKILEAFSPLYIGAGQPGEMAVFSRYDLEANVVTVYFTPAAAQLASLFAATPCEKPSGEGIGLLVGDARAWKAFFPEKLRKNRPGP